MRVSRRRFIGMGAGAVAGSLAGGFGGKTIAELAARMDRPVHPPGGPESFRLSVCRACPGGCGVRVRCIGERAVKVDGNPLHPVSAGRLCPKGQAALQMLYHPDRIAGPLRRVGPRGSMSAFRPAAWDEALQEISVRLTLLRQQSRPEALVLVRGSSRGLGARLAARFMQAFGSPNDVALPRGEQGASLALELMQGVAATPAYDVQSAEYVLALGTALLEASSSPVHGMRAYGTFRQGRAGRRGRLVCASPRLSITAGAADEWVAVRPGTEGILAMGVAAALVAEELYDKEFVARHTNAFEDSRDPAGAPVEGLRTLLQREFALERVALETGVSVNRILHLAREFAAARPALAVGPRGGPLLSGQLFDHLAAHVLNALVGNIDAPGGTLVPEPVPLAAWPDLPDDPVAAAGRSVQRLDGTKSGAASLQHEDPERLAESLLARSPYGADALFVLDADPAFASMAPQLFTAALAEIPLIVSFATLPDDTSLQADWILPQAHPFESWDLDLSPPGVPFPIASLAAPVLEKPVHDVRSAAEVFLELARRCGGPVAAAFPWPDVQALIRSESDALFATHRGAVIGTEFDEAWVRFMERAGWWAPGYRSPDELWARARESGGWWDPMYDHWQWSRVLRTPSGLLEFRPEVLKELEEKRRSGIDVLAARGRAVGLGQDLSLFLFEPLPVCDGTGAELPFLQEILDPSLEERWKTWVEIHPQTAESLGIQDQVIVRVSSPYGSIPAKARVTERVVPGVAAMPIGLGKRAGGRWARGTGSNPLRLLGPLREPLSGLPDPGATRVRIGVETDSAALVGEEA